MKKLFLILFLSLAWSGSAYANEVSLKCVWTEDKSKVGSLKINFDTQKFKWQTNNYLPFYIEDNSLLGIIQYEKSTTTMGKHLHTVFQINRDTGILMVKFFNLTDNEVIDFHEEAAKRILKDKISIGKNPDVKIGKDVYEEFFESTNYALYECLKSDKKF